jgi:hypothetical protein
MRFVRIKNNQRILGESDFVLSVISEARENLNRKYELKSRGFDLDKVLGRLSSLFQLEKDYISGISG